jgi:ribosomal protein RSM22 (predicted rRNA methylase)
MAPFQAKGPARLSPLILRVLEQIRSEPCGARSEGKAAAVAALSRVFTKERAALGERYLDDPDVAAAYLSYFLPINLSKIQVLLDELPEDWPESHQSHPLRVLDVGSGPGTGALAVLDWINQHRSDRAKGLTVVAVDSSADALNRAGQLWTCYCRKAGLVEADLTTCEGNLVRSRNRGWHDEATQRAPYDLIILANCLNELFAQSDNSSEERADLIAKLLPLLTPHGTMMIVEPALRETSRALHQLRDRLLQEKRCTVYSPCLHEGKCPALANPHDWCHEERLWEAPAAIQQIDEEVGFIKDALKFSYLLLRTDGRTIVDRTPQTFRMVSELRKLKGDTRAWLCNELGRTEVGRLDRAESETNSAWGECQRGTIVQIEGITRKERASLGRIPDNSTVNIVRPM